MLQPCRYCGQQFNNMYKLRDHEMEAHRQQYYSDAAVRQKGIAKVAFELARIYQKKADEIEKTTK